MNPFVAEFLGTTILIVLGNGVVANVVLPRTKGHAGGLITITVGWAVAVYCGASVASAAHVDSGPHLNPALTIALLAVGKITLMSACIYIVMQMLGAMLGAYLVYQHYYDHLAVCDSADDQLACFATSPSFPNQPRALYCEVLGTFVLVFTILLFQPPELDVAKKFGLGAVGLIPVALLVLSIGLSLGGTTGYAINPARDLGPRIMHHLLPIPDKRSSDWGYAWVPVVGPVLGAILAAIAFRIVT